jgi:hippurate hydrolase
MTTFLEGATTLGERLIEIRRELHACAEVGLELPETQAIVLRELGGLGLEVTAGAGLSSVTAVLEGEASGPVVLLRADMDALPLRESTGLPFASVRGTMHACGHDLHTAGLLGAAALLAARRDTLPGRVVFMFQPGEEGWAGGRMMIDEGVLDAGGQRPVAAYALHVDCTTPAGQVVTREGPIMASASALRMTLHGTGGHAAFPHQATDVVPVAAELILAVQSFVARRVPATESAVISITKVRSDSDAGNVLPASVELEANIRTLGRETLAFIRVALPALLESIATAHGCRLETEFVDSYPVTHNDPSETRFAADVISAIGDPTPITWLETPSMASEDFAYVLDQVPGALVFLGVAPADGTSGPMHSETAVFDDRLLALHATMLAELAWRRLSLEGASR